MNKTILRGMTLALAMQVAMGARAAPVTTDDFTVATAGNLVSLCTSDKSDPLYTPARNFCHGFAVGTYRLIAMEEAASRRKPKMFCIPENPPTRDQAIAAFSEWASGRPKTLQGTPTDAIIEYLSVQYPCKQ